MQKQEEDGSDTDPLQALEQQKELAMDGNGDSGYEAESRKDPDDEIINITPPSPNKMYMYDISGQTPNNWTSTPNRKLLEYEECGTQRTYILLLGEQLINYIKDCALHGWLC